MEPLKEGIANFRDFQLENREFMGWLRAEQEHRAKLDKRRAKIHYALLTLLSGLIIALFSFLLTHYDSHRQTSFGPFSSTAHDAQNSRAYVEATK